MDIGKVVETQLSLYKFYFEIGVKLNLFFYGITGALFSFYFSNVNESEVIAWSLYIPFLFSAFMMVIFYYLSESVSLLQKDLNEREYACGLSLRLSTRPLAVFLRGSAVVSLFVLLGTAAVFALEKP